jgi:hypothetical protein
MRSVYAPLIQQGVPYIETDLRTAELAKHACNAFLALKISYANALSIEHYARPGYRLILIDDSGTDLCHSLRRSKDATILIAGISGMRGALYLNVSAGFRAALEQPFDILLKLDTDALVIGSGFEAAAADFFRAHPRVATLGAHNRDYDGTPANKSWERNQILRHMTIRWRNTPKTSAFIGWLIVRAWRHGYGRVCGWWGMHIQSGSDRSTRQEQVVG